MMDLLAQAEALADQLNGTEPAPSPVSLADAKKHLKREDDDDQDALIQIYLDAAIGHIDGRDGWLGRAIRLQQLEHRLPCFSTGVIRLPYPPLVSIESVEQRTDTAWAAIDPATWEMDNGVLVPLVGYSWPATGGAVRIGYTAGYTAGTLPPAIRAAVLLMTEDLFRNRGSVAAGQRVAVPMSLTVETLLQPFRVFA